MIGRFVFGVPPLLPPVCLSILRLPPLLPPIGRVDLNWAVEGEEKAVVGREGQKGCAVFWVFWGGGRALSDWAGGALELARLLLWRLVSTWIGDRVKEWTGGVDVLAPPVCLLFFRAFVHLCLFVASSALLL